MIETPYYKKIKVLVLNCSLKYGLNTIKTEELAAHFLEKIKQLARRTTVLMGASGKTAFYSLGLQSAAEERWDKTAALIEEADILIFASPVVWRGKSSLVQRVIEDVNVFDNGDVSMQSNTEDTLSGIMEFLTLSNFSLPEKHSAHWRESVGMTAPNKRFSFQTPNKIVEKIAERTARNLIAYAHTTERTLLSQN